MINIETSQSQSSVISGIAGAIAGLSVSQIIGIGIAVLLGIRFIRKWLRTDGNNDK